MVGPSSSPATSPSAGMLDECSSAGVSVAVVDLSPQSSPETSPAPVNSRAPNAGPGDHKSASRTPSSSRTVRIAAPGRSSSARVLATVDLLTLAALASATTVDCSSLASASATRRAEEDRWTAAVSSMSGSFVGVGGHRRIVGDDPYRRSTPVSREADLHDSCRDRRQIDLVG